jgi:hypothetical protein
MAANLDEIRIAPSTIVHDPHNEFWLSTHLIDCGSGNPYCRANDVARAVKSTVAVDRRRSNRFTITPTQCASSSAVHDAGIATRNTPPTS